MGYLGLVFCEAPAAAQRQRRRAASTYLQLRKLVLALTQVLKQTKQQWNRGKVEALMIGSAGEKRELWAECETPEGLEVKRVSCPCLDDREGRRAEYLQQH